MGTSSQHGETSVKLLLDENLQASLAEALRRRGYDALSVQEAGLNGVSDVELLEWAVRERRAVISYDLKDFEALAVQYFRRGKPHFGIIVAPQQGIQAMLQKLNDLLRDQDAAQLKDQLRYL